MTQPDYYQIMGLSRDATEKDIKTAYRRLARQYHPDLNASADAKEKFQTLGEAYDVLKDPEKRRAYDAGQYHQTYNTEQPSPQDFNHHFTDHNTDWFEALFGHAKTRHDRHSGFHGAHHTAHLNLNLEDAYHGAVQTLQLGNRRIKVTIPSGVHEGQRIRLAGQGEPGHAGGTPGDLYIIIHITPHPYFDVVEQDIYLTLPVTPWEAALGASLQVPTLDGFVSLKIPPHAQGGQTLRLKGRGLKGKKQGDQYVRLKIMIPKATTEEQKHYYEHMAKLMPFNPRDQWSTQS